MSRERMTQAAKKQAKAESRWGPHTRQFDKPDQFIWETCGLCGRKIVVNNYPDLKPRRTIFMGIQHCAWCPKNFRVLIRALKFLHWMAKQEGEFGDKARELVKKGNEEFRECPICERTVRITRDDRGNKWLTAHYLPGTTNRCHRKLSGAYHSKGE